MGISNDTNEVASEQHEPKQFEYLFLEIHPFLAFLSVERNLLQGCQNTVGTFLFE